MGWWRENHDSYQVLRTKLCRSRTDMGRRKIERRCHFPLIYWYVAHDLNTLCWVHVMSNWTIFYFSSSHILLSQRHPFQEISALRWRQFTQDFFASLQLYIQITYLFLRSLVLCLILTPLSSTSSCSVGSSTFWRAVKKKPLRTLSMKFVGGGTPENRI